MRNAVKRWFLSPHRCLWGKETLYKFIAHRFVTAAQTGWNLPSLHLVKRQDFVQKLLHQPFFDRSTCSKRSKESLFSGNLLSIYSILVYFIMFLFQVLTCLRIVSIRIILNLNKFRHVQTCLRITWIVTIHIILNLNKFRHDWGW